MRIQINQSNSSIRFWIAGLFMSIILLISPAVAFAHASVVKSNPVAGATVGAPPKEVQIWFDEAVQASFYGIDVTDASGKRIDTGDGHLAENNHALLECTLKQGLKNGFYLTHWHAVSDDGHHVSGTISFSIGSAAQTMTVPAVSTANQTLPPFLVVANRWIQYLSMILFTGLFFFVAFILDKRIRDLDIPLMKLQKIVVGLLTLLTVSIVASFPIQASVDSGKSILDVWHISLFKVMLSTQFGRIFVWQVCLVIMLIFAALIMRRAKPSSRHHMYKVMIILSLGLLISKSLTGHAISSNHPIYSVIADSFHLAAASVWVGSLVGLGFLLPNLNIKESWREESYFGTIRQFSIWGIVTVLILVATGLYATFMNIPDLYTLIHTRYGQTLDVKLFLFIVMILFALFHLVQGQKRERKRPLTRTILTELAFGVCVLLVTAILTNLPTAKLSPGPYTNTQSLPDGSNIILFVTPNVAGVNELDVFLKTKEGTPMNQVDDASIALTSLDHNTGTNTYPIQINKKGQAKLVGLYLSTAGKWYVTVHVLVDKENDEYAHFQFAVGSPS